MNITKAWIDEAHILDAVLSAADSEKLNRAFAHLMDDGEVGIVVCLGDSKALLSVQSDIDEELEPRVIFITKEQYWNHPELQGRKDIIVTDRVPRIEIAGLFAELDHCSSIPAPSDESDCVGRRNKSDRKRNRQNRWR